MDAVCCANATALRGGSRALRALCRRFPGAYYATALISSPRLSPLAGCWQALHELHEENTWIGVSELGGNSFLLKLIAADSLSLRRALIFARGAIYESLGRTAPGLRRT